MTKAVLSALWAHWRRSPIQLFALIGGLALATALWCGVQAINSEARASYDAAAATLGEGQFDQLLPRVGDTISQARYIDLRRAGWQVSPVLEGSLGQGSDRVRLVGIEPLTAPGTLAPVSGNAPDDLTRYLTTGLIFAAPDSVASVQARTEIPVIEAPDLAPRLAIADIGVAQQLLEQPDTISRLVVAAKQPRGLTPVSELAPDLVRQIAQDGNDVGRLTDSFHLNLTAFGLLSFAVGLFVVHGTISLAFEQRRPLVRTLRALGVPLRRVLWLMAAELLVLALVSAVLGIVLGYVIAASLLPDVAATLRGLYGADVAGSLQIRPDWWLSGLAIALAGTSVAAAGAMWRTARVPLLETAQPAAWATASGRVALLLSLAGAALLIVAALAGVWGGGLPAGFLLLGSLLLGAALLLPLALHLAVGLGVRLASGPIANWFWSDTRVQVPGLSLALMSLLLATAANVGVSTMVSSFRLTFIGFLDQRLAAELYVAVEDAAQASELEAFLAPRVDAVLPVLSSNTTLNGLPASLWGVRVSDTYRENWQFLAQSPAAWDQVAGGRGVVVNEQLARRTGIWVGDTLAVAPDTALPIVGIVADYGNPVGQAVVGEALFSTLMPDVQPTRFGLRTQDVQSVISALTDEFGLSTAAIIDQAQIKAFSLDVFERTFTVTGALNVLTLLVAAFAILMSLLTMAAQRVPQLAPAWALGLTRVALGRLELLRALVLAAITTVLALPLGLLLAWVLLAVINVEAFGWRLPMFLFPAHYAQLLVFAVIAAALAAAWPAWRLARTPPGHLLKVFANDR